MDFDNKNKHLTNMKYEILKDDHPILRQKASLVDNFDSEIKSLVENMKETMFSAGGIGLAAPQIGISKKIITVLLSSGQTLCLINPKIMPPSFLSKIWINLLGEKKIMIEEGCLSISNKTVAVPRQASIKVQFQDLTGKYFTKKFTGIDSICIQHEIDHLNGILMTDYFLL